MSRLETVALALTHGLAGAIRPAARPASQRLRRAMDAWPLLLIAIGGMLTLLWGSVLAWATFRLAAWLL